MGAASLGCVSAQSRLQPSQHEMLESYPVVPAMPWLVRDALHSRTPGVPPVQARGFEDLLALSEPCAMAVRASTLLCKWFVARHNSGRERLGSTNCPSLPPTSTYVACAFSSLTRCFSCTSSSHCSPPGSTIAAHT